MFTLLALLALLPVRNSPIVKLYALPMHTPFRVRIPHAKHLYKRYIAMARNSVAPLQYSKAVAPFSTGCRLYSIMMYACNGYNETGKACNYYTGYYVYRVGAAYFINRDLYGYGFPAFPISCYSNEWQQYNDADFPLCK